MNSKITYLLSGIIVILVLLLVATFPSNINSQMNTETGKDLANTTNEQNIQSTAGEQDVQSTKEEKSTPSLKGNFIKLIESSKDLGKLAVGNTKEIVAKTFNAKPVKSAKLNSEEYDYYERYELKEGKYDIYYKANKLVGATAF